MRVRVGEILEFQSMDQAADRISELMRNGILVDYTGVPYRFRVSSVNYPEKIDWAKWLKSEMKIKNITKKQLVNDCQLGSNTVSKWFEGQNPSFETVQYVVDYLGYRVKFEKRDD